jgi:hypothetical protein
MNHEGERMKTEFTGNDLTLKHINENDAGCIFVSFSARNSQGIGTPFGFGFFEKHDMETYFITQNKSNQWWHTPEIEEIARILRNRKAVSGKKIILYGSSMGGYAACHFRNIFQADIALALAPQIFVDKKYFSDEKRWEFDINKIQENIRFDEIKNINAQNAELFIFTDSLHSLDKLHVEYLLHVREVLSPLTIINIPYSNHDVARLLAQTGVIQQLLIVINESGLFDYSIIPLCKELYLQDAKCFFNYFRHFSLQTETDTTLFDDLQKRFFLFLSQTKNMDFEALYMAAECFSKIGIHDKAIDFIEKSITKYQFSSEVPLYLYLKRDSIYKNSNLIERT